jgi:hypothetical protein
MAEGLELEGAVLDVETPGQELLELVEQGRQVSIVEAGVVDHDVCGKYGQVSGDR